MFQFLSDKLHIHCGLPEVLFEDSKISTNPDQFSFQSSFRILSPSSRLNVTFALGQRDGRTALFWDTVVMATDDVPASPETFIGWLGSVHLIIEGWFFNLIEGELEAEFA